MSLIALASAAIDAAMKLAAVAWPRRKPGRLMARRLRAAMRVVERVMTTGACMHFQRHLVE